MWTKKLAAMILAAVMIFSAATPASAETGYDWEKGVLRTSGLAAFKTEELNANRKNGLFFYSHSRQGARLDALRCLVEYLISVQVISNETDDEITTYLDDNIATQIVARGAHLTDTKFFEDGTCEVTMEIPIFGKNSAAEAMFSFAKENSKKNFPDPTTKIDLGKEQYTGLIIDCRGLKVTRALNPCIKTEDNFFIYSPKYLDYNKIFDKVINQGMAEYVTDIGTQTRAGLKPLTVKAVKMYDFNIFISKDDADKILTANKNFHFLDNCAIVIVH